MLYITPVVPSLGGNGLAMRAGVVLELLAARYDVHLLVARMYPPFGEVPEALARLCRRRAIVPARPRGGGAPPQVWKGERFEFVHVFRLAMLPVARPYLGGLLRRPKRHLDLDDIESATRRRLAALFRQNGDTARADVEDTEAARHAELEAEALQSFDRVYVCSAADRQTLADRARAELFVLPNAVRPLEDVPDAPVDSCFTFLFAGTLGYYPNEDAVRWLCTEIVPRIRALAGEGFEVHIAGAAAPKGLRETVEGARLRWIGEVENLAPYYAAAHAVIVPLRAGGGTRIKVLEAFGYRRPVVATSIGVEGIEARPDEEVLLGDTPDEIAHHCARLIADGALRERLACHAHALLLRNYTIDALGRALDGR